MCGIGGIAGLPDREATRQIIRKMADRMAHRGPDAEGFFIDDGIGLLHRRLSIIDLSEAGNQPMSTPDGKYTLVFNGEIYNYKSIRAELTDYNFKSDNDAEVVLAAYQSWGQDLYHRLQGMFAIAIWDAEKRVLSLVRDRMGIKPMYYARRGNQLVFASEIRALMASGLVEPKLNPNTLADYLRYQTVYGRETILEGVKMLGAGCWLDFSVADGKAETVTKWDACEAATRAGREVPGTAGEAQKRVYQLLSKAIEKRMMSDVPLGAFLSGGIDSSAVVALMAQASEQPVDTFSVVFDDKKFDESQWSQMVADKFNTRHHPILLQPEAFLEELPNALAAMDHPSGDGINSYVVSKVTKNAGITVALSGLGGDELFAGYPIFKQLPEIQNRKLLWKTPGFLRKMAGAMAGVFPGGRKGEKIQTLLGLAGNDFKSIYPVFRTVFSNKDLEGLLSDPFRDRNPALSFLVTEDEAQPLPFEELSPLSKISYAEISTYTRDVLLRDTDQMSMAHALEARVPFFDHQLVEYVLAIPDAMKYPAYPKKLLVESLGDLLPKEVVHRKKMGFVFPWERWLKKELKGFCTERLNRLADRKAFNAGKVREMWADFQAGKGTVLWLHIWLLVILEDWLERNGVEA